MFKIAWCPDYIFDVPAGHKFPMEKYDLLPKQLLYEGTIEETNLFEPELIDPKYILAVHDPIYFSRLKNLELSPREQRVSGFLHNVALIQREMKIMEGTRRACDFAIEFGIAANIAGGTHHAFTNRAEGFCLLNDNAIAANYLIESNQANKILIIDLDVHQGNGTAEIFAENSSVFTFSMHGKDNYPMKKEISSLDIELSYQCSDKEYLSKLETGLNTVLNQFQPDFILYQSGVDILQTDKLGKLGVTMNGLKERENRVLEFVKTCQVPMVAAMGGGYSPEIKTVIDAHAYLFRQIQRDFF